MTPLDIARDLSFWSGPVEPQPIKGGITNANFLVVDQGQKYFVRIGADIPVHGVMRFNEAAASRAAALCGLSPAIRHIEEGALVLDYIEAKTLSAEDVRRPDVLARILPLVQRCHREMPRHVRGPVLIFWVFHVLRSYAHALEEGGSIYRSELPELMEISDLLERSIGPTEIVFGHNDLLPSNFLDDGNRLWLIDWDYAGFNSPLFDLANLASNNELSVEQERHLLTSYFGSLSDQLWRSYSAMKCASLLRETMWSMVSEIHSTLDFDYRGYTAENKARFDRAFEAFKKL